MDNWNRIFIDILDYKFTKEFIKESGIGLKINIDLFLKCEIIYLVKIFWKINNLENYLETGDVCISIDSSITDYQYFPLNGYLMWFVWIWMPHLFLNKRSLFGLTGKGPWGRITHSEYVIRRCELHWRSVLKTRYLRER